MIKQRILISFLGLLLFSASASANDPEKLLNAMAAKLAQARQMSVTVNMNYDVVQESGQKIQFSEIRKYYLKRPYHVRVDATHSDGKINGMVFNGRLLTLFDVSHNVFSVTDRPGNVDSIIRYLVSQLGVRVPLARLFVSTLPQELERLTTRVDHVETSSFGGMPVEHIAGRSKDIDYQVWLGQDNLPRRIVITYKQEPGQPQFQANFSGWNLTTNIPDKKFRITPPRDAEKIPMLKTVNRKQSPVDDKGGK